MEEGIWQKRSRVLGQGLIFSVAINLALLATWSYSLLQDVGDRTTVPVLKASSETTESSRSNAALLQQLCEREFQELILLLNDKELFEEGYQKRDLALAILSNFHQFDFERALGGAPVQKRQILFSIHPDGEIFDLSLCSGLTDEQYSAIIRFANTEQWPLTAEGLFFEIKRGHNSDKGLDIKLIESFLLTEEYLASATLFHRCGVEIARSEFIKFLAQCDWMAIRYIQGCQARGEVLGPTHLRIFLCDSIRNRSKMGAELLIAFDPEFAFKRLSDEHVLFVLDTLDLHSEKSLRFTKMFLSSTRSERVVRIAAEKLYANAHEPFPTPFSIIDAVRRFSPEMLVQSSPESATALTTMGLPSSSFHIYKVQKGDSLWKIARQHKISVESLVEANGLETERLKIGQELQIPDHAVSKK
jgi:hypothetical protein